VEFARRVLVEITANIGQQNIDELLRQAEQMLIDIRRRDFSQKTHDAQEELARAIEGLCLSVCLCVCYETSHIKHMTHRRNLPGLLKVSVFLSVCVSVCYETSHRKHMTHRRNLPGLLKVSVCLSVCFMRLLTENT